MKFGIGQAVTRIEDQALLTGGGEYTDDVKVRDLVHAYVLRAPVAHARISSIDTSAAEQADGVLTILTGADVEADGLGDLPCMIPLENRDGSARADTPRPLLAKDTVRHVGDPVALVVATSLNGARDAAERITVDYDPLDAVTDTVGATEPGAPQVWPHIRNNICFDWENGDKDAVEAAIAEAAHVTRLEIVNNRLVVNAMEPRSALADYDPGDDRSTLYSPTQGVHIIYPQIAEMILKIGKDKLRCRTTNVGGGFGMKAFCYPEQCLTVWASRRLKRPVKWTADRSESFLCDDQGRDNVSRAELAMDKDGRFLGLKVTTYAGMGAYLSNFAPMIPTMAGTNMLAGLYKTPAIYVNVLGVVTNTVPVDAYRGAGRPEAAYLIERLVDHAAREIGLGPAEIRRRNFIAAAEMPYKTAMGDVYDSGDFVTVMEKAMAEADWEGFAARRADSAERGRLRGIGMGTYIERCGGGRPESALIRFNDDDTVTLIMGTQDNGQGHQTVYRQIVADSLGLAPEAVSIVQGDTDITPPGLTGGSRSVPVGGAAILGVSDKVKEKGKRLAAHMLEAASADIAFEDGEFRVAGTDRAVSLFAVAREAREARKGDHGEADLENGLDDEYTRTPEAATYPNGCHIVELEIDPATGVLEILRYTIVDDFGDVINPLLLLGQVHGGIGQGIGQAVTEHTVYDPESGQLLSGSFMDYTMPRADDMPFFDFSMHNVPCTTNPLGIKGSGEAGSIGAPPAIVNAAVDALHAAAGITHIDMPLTPLRIWEALQSKAKAAA